MPKHTSRSYWRCLTLLATVPALLACTALPGIAQAENRPENTPTKADGLQITPVRQFLSADAGKAITDKFTVANLTSGSLHVTFNIQQFSVTDYTYDYTFGQPGNDWLHLEYTEVVLPVGERKDIRYSIDVPADGKPGGYYYTLLASADLTSNGLNGTVQAADLAYLTVNGNLVRSSQLKNSSIGWLSFGRDISFSLQPINTGNVHVFAYVSGQLHGLTTKPEISSGAHLLMPGKVRDLTGNIPSPILPGIYRATYGYKTDADQTVMTSHLVLFIPPWFIATLLGALLLAGKFLPRRKQKKQPKPTEKTNN